MKNAADLKRQIASDLKQAMKDRKSHIASALKLIVAELKNKEIQKKRNLDSNEIVAILNKQIKQYQETIAQYEKIDRKADAEESKSRLLLVQSYLPKPLSDADLKSLIEASIQKLQVSSLKQMGAVIKDIQLHADDFVDNRRLVELVKERLQSL